ncbi:MAG: radical SAM protein, partial [Candidatus Omnitrophota bacterium]
MDKYGIDGHKLMYHVQRVNEWLDGKEVYPVYMEVSLAGACNHRCTYCGLDFMGYKRRSLDTSLFKERISELGGLGLKSIMYGGEGEPFLHRDAAELICHTGKSGIDVGVTTNGVLLEKAITDDILSYTAWIKVGIDGATSSTHSGIHRCDAGDFDRIIRNMSYAADLKKKNGFKCTLGMQLLLLPENRHEVIQLAELSRDIGMDYLVVKPYSQHLQSETTKYGSLRYSDYGSLENELAKFNTDNFDVIFRAKTMKKWDAKACSYARCFALSFWSYIDARGNVWGCSV